MADGKETLGYYEAHLTTAGGQAVEAEVLPDGTLKAEAEDKEAKPAGEKK